jgi:hypothetical protein
MKNYYDVLGVERDAPTEEIRIAYKILVKKFHPDVNPEQRDFFEKKSKELNEAYETLSNPSKREQYDIRLDNFLNNRNNNYQSSQKEEQDRKQEEENLKNQQEEAQKEREEQEEIERREQKERRKKEQSEENIAEKHKKQNKNVLYGFLGLIIIAASSFGGYVLYRYNVKYDKAYSFYQDLARVEKQEGIHFLDGFSNLDFGTYKKMYGFVDRNDNVVIRIIYDDAHDFSDGLAAVRVSNENVYDRKWGFVDKSGNMVIPPRYDFVSDFENGSAWVTGYYNSELYKIDKKGNCVEKCK